MGFPASSRLAARTVHDRDAVFGAAEHEGRGTVRQDSGVFRLRNDGDACAQSKRCGVVDPERPVAAIHDHDGFPIGRNACKDGLMSGYGAREDGVRLSVNRKKRVVPGSGGEDAIAIQ